MFGFSFLKFTGPPHVSCLFTPTRRSSSSPFLLASYFDPLNAYITWCCFSSASLTRLQVFWGKRPMFYMFCRSSLLSIQISVTHRTGGSHFLLILWSTVIKEQMIVERMLTIFTKSFWPPSAFMHPCPFKGKVAFYAHVNISALYHICDAFDSIQLIKF